MLTPESPCVVMKFAVLLSAVALFAACGNGHQAKNAACILYYEGGSRELGPDEASALRYVIEHVSYKEYPEKFSTPDRIGAYVLMDGERWELYHSSLYKAGEDRNRRKPVPDVSFAHKPGDVDLSELVTWWRRQTG